MPLIYDQNLNKFIYDPLPETQNPPSPTAPLYPKSGRDRSFSQCPKIEPLAPVKQGTSQSSLWEGNKLDVLIIVSGWIGIAIYYHHYPVQFSLVGVFFYLCCNGLQRFLMRLAMIVCEDRLDTGDREDFITIKLGSFEYEILRESPFLADFPRRRIFFEELRSRLIKLFPKLNGLYCKQYDYDNIRLSSNLNQLRDRNKQKQRNTQDQKILHELVRNPEALRRWRYKDPRFQEFPEQFKTHREKIFSNKQAYWRLIILFLIVIPSEDGLFFAPPVLLGVSAGATVVFALLFGFAHFWKYSAIQCLSIALPAMVTISFILPKYGLLTCMVGHVLFDLECFYGIVDALLHKVRQQISAKDA